MITEKLLECFVAHDVSVLVSFYSYDQAAHDKITKHNKSFQKTVDGIRRLIFNNIPTTVCVIEMDINKGHFQHTKSFLTNLGVNNVHFDAIRGVGRGVGVSGPSRDINSERAGKPELAFSELCGQCGNGKLAILPDGAVSPCVMARSRTVGSALETSLYELLGGIQMERFRSELRKLKSVGETASAEDTEFTKIVRVPDQCSPHTNTEPMCSPGMPQPDQCSPHTNTEPMCSPGMPQPDQCSPHTNTEPMCSPAMPQPDQCSPHTNTEPMCSPGMPQSDQCSPHTNTEPMCSPGMPQSEPISRLFNNFEVGRAPIILESAASNSEIYSFQLLGRELCDKLVSIISKYKYRKSAIGSGIFMENRNSEDLIADEEYEILKMNFEKATMPIFNSVAKTLWSWDCNAIVDLSLVKYEKGCYFKEHVDAYNGKTQAKRHISFIVYLSDEFEGGETYFRRQGQTIYPRRGKAVMFPSGVTHPHEGRTVKSGTKFAVVGWLARL
jgi:hypothetical protein